MNINPLPGLVLVMLKQELTLNWQKIVQFIFSLI